MPSARLILVIASLWAAPSLASDFSLGLDIDGGVDVGDAWRVRPGRPAFGLTVRTGWAFVMGPWMVVPEVTFGGMGIPASDTTSEPQRLLHVRGGTSFGWLAIPHVWIGARAHVGYGWLWGPADSAGMAFDPDGFSMIFGGVIELAMSPDLDVGLHFDYGALLDRTSKAWIGWLAPGFHVGMRF